MADIQVKDSTPDSNEPEVSVGLADTEAVVSDAVVSDAIVASLAKQIEDVAKVLSAEAIGEKKASKDEDESGSNAPPSTPTKDQEEKKPRRVVFNDFPRFKVTWDSSIPNLMSPGKKRKNSQSVMVERFGGVPMAQEMSPQVALVEFIVTSASFHGVERQHMARLEDELFRVCTNNVMPANAAAWYMAKRRFYLNEAPQNQLLPMLLKEYPKKFAIKNDVVQFLESYTPTIAKKKMQYIVSQGLYAYFSHKADEYGVYFFDPLYYESTEPFHANLRMVTNIYNNTNRSKIIPSFFRIFNKQFHYQHISPYLVAISKTEIGVVEGVAGIIVEMLDNKYGLIKFNRGSETEMALFSVNALFSNGFPVDGGNPLTFPPVHMDAYKIPNGDKLDQFKWFAVLTWVGRKPNPKFCSTKEELTTCPAYTLLVGSSNNNNSGKQGKNKKKGDYMKMGTVVEICKNGAVAAIEDSSEDKYFVPGWSYRHVNTLKTEYLTTTQGVGLGVGDLINFYVDTEQQAKPYTAVACNVDVLKPAERSGMKAIKKTSVGKKAKKTRTVSMASTASSTATKENKPEPVSWRDFLITEELAAEDLDDEAADPEYKQPENHEETDDDSTVSDEELLELQAVEEAIKAGKAEGHLDIEELSQVLETVAIIDSVTEEAEEPKIDQPEETKKSECSAV
jgi:hypothetical protein